MVIFKKLIFVPFFLIVFAVLVSQLTPLFTSYDFIFSLSTDSLIKLIILSALISLSSFLFVIFVTLSTDWRLSLSVGLLASLISFLFLEVGLAIVLSVAILVTLLITTFSLEGSLKSYLTFQPNSLLGPSIRHLAGLLILTVSLVYFLSANKLVAEKGFQIPDSLIDTALNFTQLESSQQLDTPQNLANDLIKQTVKDQIQNLIKPYSSFIPAFLAVLLFLTLQSLTSLINLLIYPLLWITFYILEKSGFVHFETETREVKKLVV